MTLNRLAVWAFATVLGASSPAFADVIVLTFEGAGDEVALQNFYNGGTDAAGNSGTNYGVQFGGGALSIIDLDAGGSGNFANEPTASTILFFLQGSAILNFAAGFDTGFSFLYTAVSDPGFVNVWSDLNATGVLLGTINLPVNGSTCGGDPAGDFNCWTNVGLPFAGTAKSIDFAGTANQIGFDNVTFGSAVAQVPEPASMLLVGTGVLVALRRRRRHA